jgi:hypothetical protein
MKRKNREPRRSGQWSFVGKWSVVGHSEEPIEKHPAFNLLIARYGDWRVPFFKTTGMSRPV